MVAPPKIYPYPHPGTAECDFIWEKWSFPELVWDLNPMSGILKRERYKEIWDSDTQDWEGHLKTKAEIGVPETRDS